MSRRYTRYAVGRHVAVASSLSILFLAGVVAAQEHVHEAPAHEAAEPAAADDGTAEAESTARRTHASETSLGADATEAKTPAGAARGKSKAAPKTEVIQVRGMRRSAEQALTTKRMADSIVDAVASEDIAKFPDENVAEALQRITGVTMTQGFGEGQRISIRGMGPGRNLTLLNGQGLASSSFGLEGSSNRRAFNFAMLPSELISSVEVYKSPEARLQEGAIGGTVILRTRPPLDQDKPLVVAGSLAGGYSDLSNKLDPRATLVLSYKAPGGKFGVSVGGIHQERSLRRDALEILVYEQPKPFPAANPMQGIAAGPRVLTTANGQPIPNSTDAFIPSFIGSALFQQKRVRDTLMASFHYVASDELTLQLNTLYSRLGGDNSNHNFATAGHYAQHAKNGVNSIIGPNTFVDATNTATVLQVLPDHNPTMHHPQMCPQPQPACLAAPDVQLGSILRLTALQLGSVDLKTEYMTGPLILSNHTGFTRATGGAGHNLWTRVWGKTGYTVDIRDRVGGVQFTDLDPNDPAQLYNYTSSRVWNWGIQQQGYTQFDGEYRLNSPWLRSVLAGVRVRAQSQHQLARRGIRNFETPPFWSLAEAPVLPTPPDFLAGIGGPNVLRSYRHLDNWNVGTREEALSNYTFEETPDRFFKILETIGAFYLQANLSAELGGLSLRGNAGVRYVHTWQQSQAKQARLDEQGNQIPGPDGRALVDLILDKRGYGKLLPSLNLTLDVNEYDLVFRLAAARGMSRPTFDQLTPLVSLNDTTMKGRGGNPNLPPFIADQVDLSAEYYFTRGSGLSVASFFKRVHAFVGMDERSEELQHPANGQWGTYLVTRPYPMDGGRIFGVEAAYNQTFDFLPAPLNGLGLIANYTHVQSTSNVEDPLTRRKLPVPGQSRHGLNMITFFEHGRFGVRLAYNYRTRYFETVVPAGPRFVGDFGRLDGNMSLRVNKHLGLFVEGLNLTDTVMTRYIAYEYRPYQHMRTGRRFFLGVRGRY